MTASRSNQEERLYKQYRNKAPEDICVFCDVKEGHPQFVEQTRFFKIIRNRFPYSIWDGLGVNDHLMAVPKKHVSSLSELPDQAGIEYLQLLSKYERAHYNLYARAPSSNIKSIMHQHTHLLQLDNRKKRIIFLVTKPFYRRLSI